MVLNRFLDGSDVGTPAAALVEEGRGRVLREAVDILVGLALLVAGDSADLEGLDMLVRLEPGFLPLAVELLRVDRRSTADVGLETVELEGVAEFCELLLLVLDIGGFLFSSPELVTPFFASSIELIEGLGL